MDATEKTPNTSSVLSSPPEFYALRPSMPGEYISNPDGSRSSELTMTFRTESGEWVNAPSLWVGKSGHVKLDSEDKIYPVMKNYEATTGKKFTRYRTVEDALSAAKIRSNKGGAFSGSLAR